ncbi:MAG TPA: ROK family protein [Actinomycetota bacterium]|nr:ROK family protein [Actinomycetota bacterium]
MTVRSAAIGVDVGGTTVKAGLVDMSGAVVDRLEQPTEHHAATKSTIEISEAMVERAQELGYVPVAVGIGAAGFVDVRKGSITFSPNLVYDDPDVADAVAARLNIPVMVENDANAAAWGERTAGAGKDALNMAFIILGTGLGSGFVVNGRLVRGATGAGAEFGHTVVDPDGPSCNCGLRGCIEQFASGQAIARMGRAAAAKDPSTSMLSFAASADAITSLDVGRAAREMDETARDVLRRSGRMLGIALSNVVNIFDPEVIVLSGRVTEAGEPFLGPARDQLAEMTTAQRRRPVSLRLGKLGRDAGIVGSAALAIDELSRGGADRDPNRGTS